MSYDAKPYRRMLAQVYRRLRRQPIGATFEVSAWFGRGWGTAAYAIEDMAGRGRYRYENLPDYRGMTATRIA